MLRIVLQSDANRDGKFCKVETKMLVLKIKLHLSEYGVEFDEHKFYKVMTRDADRGGDISISKTLLILKRLIPACHDAGDEEESEEEEDAEMYDMFRMTSEGSRSLSGSMRGASMIMGKRERRRSSLARNQQDSLRRQRHSPKNSPHLEKSDRKRLSSSSG